MSRCVSLNQTRANASASWSGCSRKRRAIGCVDRVEPQREVRRQERRGVGLRRVVGVRHGAGPAAVPRDPLPQAGGAQRHVPLVAEQGLEVAVVPPGRGGRPRPVEAAGDGVGALPACRGGPSSPAPAPRAGRPRARGRGSAPDRPRRGSCRTCARPRSARRSPRRHPHPAERLADVPGRHERVGDGVRALRVDVDQAHLVGGQRVRPAPGRRGGARRRARSRSGPQ